MKFEIEAYRKDFTYAKETKEIEKKYKDELFAIKRGKTRNRYITRYSSKNKLLKIFFYSI